jgi:hypothetical protein
MERMNVENATLLRRASRIFFEASYTLVRVAFVQYLLPQILLLGFCCLPSSSIGPKAPEIATNCAILGPHLDKLGATTCR